VVVQHGIWSAAFSVWFAVHLVYLLFGVPYLLFLQQMWLILVGVVLFIIVIIIGECCTVLLGDSSFSLCLMTVTCITLLDGHRRAVRTMITCPRPSLLLGTNAT